MHHPPIDADLLGVLRDGTPRTRSELAELTGRARSTVAARLDDLVARGVIVDLGDVVATRGRPSATYALGIEHRLIAAIELGATHGVVAVTDVVGRILAHRAVALDITSGPPAVLTDAMAHLDALLGGIGRSRGELVGLGLGLPGPVADDPAGRISAAMMPGWDRFDIVGHLRNEMDVPIAIDNDVNLMALGERDPQGSASENFVVVKVAAGIGMGIVAAGSLVRGAVGAAGEIGHMRVDARHDRPCRCGQIGCCETMASGAGIARTLREQGIAAASTDDIVALVRGGDLEATRVVREAGRTIGQALVTCICLLNPARIMVGGELAAAMEPLLAGMREVIYRRSQPLASGRLQIVPTTQHDLAGVIGASRLVQEVLFGTLDGRTTASG